MPTYMIGLTAFNTKDFKYVEKMSTDGNTRVLYLFQLLYILNNQLTYYEKHKLFYFQIRLWAQNVYVDEGYTKEPLEMIVNIYDNLKELFRMVNESSFASKIDVFAIPDYPVIF